MTDRQIFELTIKANSPLSLGNESRAGNFLYTRDVITGAMLRGVVAARTLADCTQPAHKEDHAACPDRDQCPFWQIFGKEEEEPYFSYAYPGRSGPAYPFPLTAWTCKVYAGYDKPGHGVYDALIDQFVYNLVADPRFPDRDRLQPSLAGEWATLQTFMPDACPVCRKSVKPAPGTYIRRKSGPTGAGSLSVRRATHVGVNRSRAVAEDRLLFTVETIEPQAENVKFHARVVASKPTEATLKNYLRGDYHVGRGRSRGLGSVTFTCKEQKPIVDLEARLDRFGQAVRSTLIRYQQQDQRIKPDLPGLLFSLTLRSPAILESFGCPVAVPEPEEIGIIQARLLQAWARTEIITGWDSAAELPRRTRLAVRPGSVFLYWVPDDADRDALLTNLAALEVEGIGEERPRGYGCVTVCAPFHWDRRLGDSATERSVS